MCLVVTIERVSLLWNTKAIVLLTSQHSQWLDQPRELEQFENTLLTSQRVYRRGTIAQSRQTPNTCEERTQV